ncbi:MAG: sn-glycerol-1-phosphate dehydrogenase [Rhizobiales bacterium]|nr:sn-glycerol-1-phosphate dehydrogenase [Hyphomicrobiales bacterium]
MLHARELRDRFTMLDLSADCGLLGRFVDEHLAAA